MDVRQLRQFVVLAETLNFRRTAELLHMSQPPLSVAIRKLEDSFGMPLFERSTRHVKLTEAGDAALEDVRKALFHLDQAQRHARETVEGVRGLLRVGCVGSATLSLIPRILPSFRQRYPGIDLVLRDYPSNRIIEEVERGLLDVGLVRSPIIDRYQVSSVLLEADRLIAVVPAGNVLATREQIALADLADSPFVSYSREEATGLHYAVSSACQAAGFIPRVVQESTQIQATISLVAAGLGVALIPSLHGRRRVDGVHFLSLTDASLGPDIGLSLIFSTQTETGISRAFRSTCIEVMAHEVPISGGD
jgi:DNA-binding transcriptional LysR family regulator